MGRCGLGVRGGGAGVGYLDRRNWVIRSYSKKSRISFIMLGGKTLSLGRMRLSNLMQDLCDITFLCDEELFARIPDHDLAVLQSSLGNSCARAMIRI